MFSSGPIPESAPLRESSREGDHSQDDFCVCVDPSIETADSDQLLRDRFGVLRRCTFQEILERGGSCDQILDGFDRELDTACAWGSL